LKPEEELCYFEDFKNARNAARGQKMLQVTEQPSVRPEMVDFGSGQGLNIFTTGGVVLLR
jgi:hypothetical protein